jgi:hypothetical protein
LAEKTGFSASAVAADDKLYLTSEEGEVVIMQPGPQFKVLARHALGEPCLATPALSDGVLYFRTQHHIIAIDGVQKH